MKHANMVKAIIIALLLIAFTAVMLSSSLLYKKPQGAVASPSPSPENSPTPQPYPSPENSITLNLPEGLTVPAAASGQYFYIRKDQQWNCIFLKGVNIGLTLPTTDLNDPDIPYETYLQWFDQIGKMNANTIKVFTIMNPDFYNALYYYNSKHPQKPLYLLHGLWFNEEDMYTVGDAFGENGKILESLKRASREAIDIIHGNSSYTSYGSVSPAVYYKDVSQYVIGWILGLEWSPDFVAATNKKHPEITEYTGTYLKTKNASAFESFLCETGEYAIEYETDSYSAQRPVAFLNWQSTDPLRQDNEPFPEEDNVQIHTENILSTSRYYAGLFAALDIYPYYPEFMNYQPEYIGYKNADGSINSYRGYLNALKKCYSVPIVVAEVGLPTSRGLTHQSVMGYHQGQITETQQGEMLLKMVQDIAYEEYAGAMLFCWQDEWFKQTWNTFKYYAENPQSRTPNKLSSEQNYGILAFEPGAAETLCYPDEDLSEWAELSPVFISEETSLFVQYDEAYLYIMGKTQLNLKENTLVLPISTTGRGNSTSSEYALHFSKPADFLLILNGQENSRLLVDAAYDYFYYQYSVLKQVFPRNSAFEKKNSGLFNPIKQFVSNEIVLPKTGETIPPFCNEAGKLLFGNANPSSENFNSLADFYFDEHSFEVRIPWYLLNILSPTEGKCFADFYKKNSVNVENFGCFYIGAAPLTSTDKIKMTGFTVERWEQAGYHARLKKSYSILTEGFKNLMQNYN